MARRANLTNALDKSLDRLSKGMSISQCLAYYPQHENDLRPLLEAAMDLRRAPVPRPRQGATDAGYARMMRAVGVKYPQRPVGSRTTHSRPWYVPWLALSGAALLVALLVGLGWLWGSGRLGDPLVQPVQAVITQTEGNVLHLAKGERTWEPARTGDVVRTGDRVQTTQIGFARLAVGTRHTVDLLASTEVAFLVLPSRRDLEAAPVVFQATGSAQYKVIGAAGAPIADPTSEASPAPAPAAHFKVRSSVLVATAERAQFSVSVAEDGATYVSVDDGDVGLAAGEQVALASAGQVVQLGAGEGAVLEVAEQDETAPPADAPQTEDGVPVTLRDDDVPTPDLGTDKEGPPGLEDTGGVPPGLNDSDKDTPPGLEDSEGVPPGLQPEEPEDDLVPTEPAEPTEAPEEDSGDGQPQPPPQPPGLDDKDVPGIPPGQLKKDGEVDAPPGLDDRGGAPPGQDKQDAEPDTATQDATPPPDEAASEVPEQEPAEPDKGPPEDKKPEKEHPSPPSEPPGQSANGGDRGKGKND